MTVLQIKSLEHTGNNGYTIQAVVESSHCIYAASYFEPAEYGDGLCQASFILADDESLPSNEDDMRCFVEELELAWIPVDWS